MVNSRTDYTAIAVEAARSVMLELIRLLGEYRDDVVIIGGWVPDLLLPQAEGLKNIKEKFASPEHIGPKWVADFDEISDPEARAMRQRDAYERVTNLLAKLGLA